MSNPAQSNTASSNSSNKHINSNSQSCQHQGETSMPQNQTPTTALFRHFTTTGCSTCTRAVQTTRWWPHASSAPLPLKTHAHLLEPREPCMCCRRLPLPSALRAAQQCTHSHSLTRSHAPSVLTAWRLCAALQDVMHMHPSPKLAHCAACHTAGPTWAPGPSKGQDASKCIMHTTKLRCWMQSQEPTCHRPNGECAPHTLPEG